MTSHDLPEWLTRALEEVGPGTIAFPDDEEWTGEINRGDVRAARPMDGQTGTRIVLVVEPGDGRPTWANAMMLTNLVEVATSKDARLNPGETSLPFPILAETDIQGPLFAAQFGPRLGHLEDEILSQLEMVASGEDLDTLADRRGLPVRSRTENRARWKGQELRAMHGLAAECFAQLISAGEEEATVIADPAIFSDVNLTNSERVGIIVGLRHLADQPGQRVEVTAEALLADDELSSVLSDTSPDEWNALAPLVNAALSQQEGLPPVTGQAKWSPARTVQESLLQRQLYSKAIKGKRSIRIATASKYWKQGPSNAMNVVEIEGIGLIQVEPELLEVAT